MSKTWKKNAGLIRGERSGLTPPEIFLLNLVCGVIARVNKGLCNIVLGNDG